jgi:hypothetical protein
VPKSGFMAGPTFYFEDRKSRVALKCYCRYSKRAQGEFGQPCVRLEWTLRGKAAIERHLKGNKIKDLLSADLNRFAKVNLLLEEVDYTALVRLIGGLPLKSRRSPVTAMPAVTGINAIMAAQRRKGDPNYLVQRMLENFAYRELKKFNGDWPLAVWACNNSPAQIRGYLGHLRRIEELRRNQSRVTSAQKKGLRKRGRPRQRYRPRSISTYRINACFQRIQLEPV